MNKKYIFEKEDSVGIYLKDVRKIDLLKESEQEEIFERIKQGDKVALDKLVTANLRFVISIAKEYQHRGLNISDLISEGNYGLITAAHKFDHTKGFKFTSYAIWWIRQAILQSINENSRMIRLPNNVINKLNKMDKNDPKFHENMMDEFSVVLPTCSSLNNVINEDGDELINLIEGKLFSRPDEMNIEGEILKKREIENAISVLSDREKNIILLYYGINCEQLTLERIGEKIGLTKERVRQVKETAIRKIRHNLGGYFSF